MRFVDLFAGLGGFHVALERLGHQCVFAAEIDSDLQKLYECNFAFRPAGDIREIRLHDIPAHDLLCAGFPCQPFSKAGRQAGLSCEKNGDLARIVIDRIRKARPPFIMLENVPNFLRHDGGRTWRWFSQELRHAGYSLDTQIVSPHDHGIPQLRDRLFIVGARDGLDHFSWPEPCRRLTDVREVLDDDATARVDLALPPHILEALETWGEFVRAYPVDRRKPWFPIWAAEFGANYPFATTAPLAVPVATLKSFRGTLGVPISGRSKAEVAAKLPPYARTERAIPEWKARFLQLNRDLYEHNRSWIDPWLPRLQPLGPSLQKFEWNFGHERSIWNSVIQLRGSGIRARATNAAPALVAATSSQTPIIGWERRYMSVRERARLQDLGDLAHLPEGSGAVTRALGNAVNAKLVELIGRKLLSTRKPHSAAA
ncbi:MAG TPA: DNA (cytosine-5-)-methyltransferase [Sphingopyxis sp.]|nr:DNA (cytosine-5-)-methyltransferase [Sphingopyxis sp.]